MRRARESVVSDPSESYPSPPESYPSRIRLLRVVSVSESVRRSESYLADASRDPPPLRLPRSAAPANPSGSKPPESYLSPSGPDRRSESGARPSRPGPAPPAGFRVPWSRSMVGGHGPGRRASRALGRGEGGSPLRLLGIGGWASAADVRRYHLHLQQPSLEPRPGVAARRAGADQDDSGSTARIRTTRIRTARIRTTRIRTTRIRTTRIRTTRIRTTRIRTTRSDDYRGTHPPTRPSPHPGHPRPHTCAYVRWRLGPIHAYIGVSSTATRLPHGVSWRVTALGPGGISFVRSHIRAGAGRLPPAPPK